MEIIICGDVPLGAGLSSSAAYEVCAAILINSIVGAGISSKALALLAQAAEHSEFVGVKCGIMDQFISTLAEKDKALMIDCYSLDYELVPFDSTIATIVIINTLRKRGLMDSAYNQRRQECDEGLKVIRSLPGQQFPTIRHVPFALFDKFKQYLTENRRKRLHHNLTENHRVGQFVGALRDNDFVRAGELLYQSHQSLKNDFEVSCLELDRIVEIAYSCPGMYGCRMTGTGFGGCAVALIEPDCVEEFSETISSQYFQSFSIKPELYTSRPVAGAGIRKA